MTEIDEKNSSAPHIRRVRYKGHNPRNYVDKYKELNPDKYGDIIEHVIKRGNTPAGMHVPICVQEILNILKIEPDEVGLDATLGYGGHTLEILKCLNNKGHLYALDIDKIESLKTKERLEKLGYNEKILTIKQLNFADSVSLVPEAGLFDFILADLGVSSMQIDNPSRGFSYKTDGPLDLRLNPLQGEPASVRLKSFTEEELRGMLRENADEVYAAEIAKSIVLKLKEGMVIDTTLKLREVIEEALSFIKGDNRKELISKSCQRTFQALRIDINDEYEVLYEFLENLPQMLNKGGRVAILTFHSGEDRLVKKAFKRFYSEGLFESISDSVIRPSKEECYINSRAHSAKLRWAIK
ncbi:MAG: 16S rRNA (cytosine(1402)-N(4))-methyltransferase RsmH [Bacilli bacterium]